MVDKNKNCLFCLEEFPATEARKSVVKCSKCGKWNNFSTLPTGGGLFIASGKVNVEMVRRLLPTYMSLADAAGNWCACSCLSVFLALPGTAVLIWYFKLQWTLLAIPIALFILSYLLYTYRTRSVSNFIRESFPNEKLGSAEARRDLFELLALELSKLFRKDKTETVCSHLSPIFEYISPECNAEYRKRSKMATSTDPFDHAEELLRLRKRGELDEPPVVNEVREIGKLVYKNGGIDLMRKVHKLVKDQSYPTSVELERAWNGVGEWLT